MPTQSTQNLGMMPDGDPLWDSVCLLISCDDPAFTPPDYPNSFLDSSQHEHPILQVGGEDLVAYDGSVRPEYYPSSDTGDNLSGPACVIRQHFIP